MGDKRPKSREKKKKKAEKKQIVPVSALPAVQEPQKNTNPIK